MPLVVSDEQLAALGLSADEVRRELAVMHFSRNKMTLAQASRMAGLDRIELQRILSARRIPLHYGTEELLADMESLGLQGEK